MRLLSRAVRPDDALSQLAPRLRMLATQAGLADRRATGASDMTTAEREQHRSTVLAELADWFAPD